MVEGEALYGRHACDLEKRIGTDKASHKTPVQPMSWFHRFQRVTSGRQFLPEIDGLRFIAIFPVVMLHLGTHYLRLNEGRWSAQELESDWLFRIRPHLEFGVPLFFAISGYILTLPFIREAREGRRVRLKSYFWRRITRLEPPYAVSLVGFALVHLVLLSAPIGETLSHFTASLFYVHEIVYGARSTINPVAWSLEIEVQFYLLAPLLCRFLFRLPATGRRMAVFFLVLITVGLRAYFLRELAAHHLAFSMLTFGQFFFAGILVADLLHGEGDRQPAKSLGWDSLALAGLCGWGAWFIPKQFAFEHHLVSVAVVVAICLGAIRGRLMTHLLSSPFVWATGGMCYTIYLLHYPLVHLTLPWTAGIDFGESFSKAFGLQLLLQLPVVWLVCAAFYLLIEKPCMDKDWPAKLRARLGRGGVRPASASPATDQQGRK